MTEKLLRQQSWQLLALTVQSHTQGRAGQDVCEYLIRIRGEEV